MNGGKKRASIKQKLDSLKTGKSYARLFIKKKAKRKLESQKNTGRGATDTKHIRYCK